MEAIKQKNKNFVLNILFDTYFLILKVINFKILKVIKVIKVIDIFKKKTRNIIFEIFGFEVKSIIKNQIYIRKKRKFSILILELIYQNNIL
jgi:hypothetical protein